MLILHIVDRIRRKSRDFPYLQAYLKEYYYYFGYLYTIFSYYSHLYSSFITGLQYYDESFWFMLHLKSIAIR